MATIKEDYVSFETAKLLKEKRFDVPCLAHWFIGTNRNFSISNTSQNWNEIKTDLDWLSCPTLQMTMKWLLREYKLYVNVAPSVEGYYWTEKWHSYVEDLNKRYPFGKFISTFNSPEEACEAAIKYCLENLI